MVGLNRLDRFNGEVLFFLESDHLVLFSLRVGKITKTPSFFVRVYRVPRHIGLFWQLDVPGSVIRQEHGSIMYDSTRKAFPQILVISWFDTS
jgi:hypothetical protein